jgi:hypothetical protein
MSLQVLICLRLCCRFCCSCRLSLAAQHGMSIGIGDTVADIATGSKIGAIIDAAKEDVQRIIEQYQVCVGEGGGVGGVDSLSVLTTALIICAPLGADRVTVFFWLHLASTPCGLT